MYRQASHFRPAAISRHLRKCNGRGRNSNHAEPAEHDIIRGTGGRWPRPVRHLLIGRDPRDFEGADRPTPSRARRSIEGWCPRSPGLSRIWDEGQIHPPNRTDRDDFDRLSIPDYEARRMYGLVWLRKSDTNQAPVYRPQPPGDASDPTRFPVPGEPGDEESHDGTRGGLNQWIRDEPGFRGTRLGPIRLFRECFAAEIAVVGIHLLD